MLVDVNEANKIDHSRASARRHFLTLAAHANYVGDGGLLERVTSDRAQKHEIHVRTNESIELLILRRPFCAAVFLGYCI